MSYRIKEHKKPKPQRNMIDASTPANIYVQNGATASFAIPCFYIEVLPPKRAHFHDRCHHDHIGWPSPSHPDHICQPKDFAHRHNCHHRSGFAAYSDEHRGHHRRYIDPECMIPIHLYDEGYTEAFVTGDFPDGISCRASIDRNEDWIVRVIFDVNTEEAETKELKIPFSVFVRDNQKRDIVSTGTLVILPGPIGYSHD